MDGWMGRWVDGWRIDMDGWIWMDGYGWIWIWVDMDMDGYGWMDGYGRMDLLTAVSDQPKHIYNQM
eukprot:6788630-Lingulodinium_polyedra.AAC.1